MLQSFKLSQPFRGLAAQPFLYGTEACLFGRRRTLIYGRNGSGKTTLSEILRRATSGGDTDGSIVTAVTRRNGATETTVLGRGEEFEGRVLVYNRYYVAESLREFLDGDGTSPTIVKLGAENVEAQRQLAEARVGLEANRLRVEKIEGVRKELRKEIGRLEQATKDKIIVALAGSDDKKYNPTTFNVTRVRALWAEGNTDALDEQHLANECAVAKEAAMEAPASPGAPPALPPAMTRMMINDELLSATVDSRPWQRLMDDVDVASWVERGLALHGVDDICKFCLDGRVASATLDAYRQHFSMALLALRQRLHETAETLASTAEDVVKWAASLPVEGCLLTEQRAEYREQRSRAVESAEKFCDQMAAGIARIRKRLADPIDPLEAEDLLTEDFVEVDVAGLRRSLDANAEACGEQATRKSDAQATVERHFAAITGQEREGQHLRLDRLAALESAIAQRISSLRDAARRLEEEQDDTTRMAVAIDEALRTHFGHRHLRVQASSDGKGYVIRRGPDEARYLSEGERNAIAFTYFIRSLEAEGVDPAQTLVVIDDPVTSMDKEALFAGFAFAEEATQAFAQVVVLTHDFEYFRLQLRQRSNALKASKKKVTNGNVEEARFPAVSVLEMVASIDPATRGRRSSLRKMPESLVAHQSEYHYLFLRVAEAVCGNDDATLPLLGNAARRLLEGFISFRAPHGDDFQQKIDSIQRQKELDPVLCRRVVKFVHGMSHREEPRPHGALDFPAIEAELAAVLRFVSNADPEHFSDLCKAVDLDPTGLRQSIDVVESEQ